MFHKIANHNFFGKPTFIRKIQCDIFGHEWFCLTIYKGEQWCGWCGRFTGKYPKMREHIEKDAEDKK